MPQKVVNVPGVGSVSFPDTMSDQDIQRVIETELVKPQRSTGTEVGIGVLSSLAKNAKQGLNVLTAGNPLTMAFDRLVHEPIMKRAEQMAGPPTAARTAAEFVTDMVPGAMAGAGGGAARQFAKSTWSRAAGRPPTEPLNRVAGPVLEKGLGRLTPENAQALAAEFRATGGPWPTTRKSIDKSFARGELGSWNPLTWTGPSPSTRATIAQGLHSTAPAAQAVAGGLGTTLLQALMRAIGQE